MDKTILKNIMSLMGIQGVNYLIPLITLPYLVRTLEPIGYGSLGFSFAIIQYFSILTDYGFNLSATQKVAINRDDKKRVSELFWAVMSCKALLCISGLVLLLAVMAFSEQVYQQRWILLSCYTMVIGTVLFPTWLFQGKEKMGWIAASNITARLSAIPLIFLLVSKSQDAWLAGLITGMTGVLAGVIGLFFVYREKWVSWVRPDFALIKSEFADGWHIFISTAAVSLYTTSTTVILGFIAGPVAVGYYVAADKLRQAAQGVFTPIAQAVYPRINALMAKDKEAGFAMIRKLFIVMGSLTGIASVVLFSLAGYIVPIIYGDTYEPSIVILRWLAWLLVIVGLSNVFGVQTLLVLGKKSIFSRILLCSGIVNLSLLIPLAMMFHQNGAAVSVVITESFVTLLMLFFIVKLKIPLFKKST